MSLIVSSDNIFAKSVIGNVRSNQEDCCGMAQTSNGDVFVVCDGVGGNVGGDKASTIAVDAIIEYFRKEQYANVPQAINDAIQYANQKILDYASVYRHYIGMSTTVCVLLLQDKNAFIAHVGDSRIYLYLGKEKKLHRLTKDHSYVQTLVDAGEITDKEAETHPRKNIILKSLGHEAEVEPTIDMLQPKNDDIFLICTDGLNGMISDDTIGSTLSQQLSVEEKGEQLIELAMQGENGRPGGRDNCTLELIQIDNSPWKNSVFTSYNPQNEDESDSDSGNEGESSQDEESQRKFSLEKILYIIVPLLLILICIKFINIDKESDPVSKKDVKVEVVKSDVDSSTTREIKKTDTEEVVEPESVEEEKVIVQEIEPEPVQEEVVTQEVKPEPEKPVVNTNSKPTTLYTKKVAFGITKVMETETEYTISYKVKNGDNITEICQLFGCTISDFKKWNNLNNNNIGAGKVYVVKPQKKNVQCKVYTVKKNEILANIVKKNKVKMDDVITCNGMKNPNSIQPGQKLIIVVKK